MSASLVYNSIIELKHGGSFIDGPHTRDGHVTRHNFNNSCVFQLCFIFLRGFNLLFLKKKNTWSFKISCLYAIWIDPREKGHSDTCVKCCFRSAYTGKPETALSVLCILFFFCIEQVCFSTKSNGVVKCLLRSPLRIVLFFIQSETRLLRVQKSYFTKRQI